MFNKMYKYLTLSVPMAKVFKLFLTMMGCVLIVNLTGCEQSFEGMLNPKGLLAFQERKLFFDTLALMLIVVLPVIIMSFAFVYHYQISHRVRDYKPHWSHSYLLESIWWAIPCIIILVLAIMTWKKTHELDPYNPIPSNQKPLLVQVISLPWKWLFIYPEQHIATVNYLELPVGQEVEFLLTTDNVPMSAFFIPQIGSQIFTMPAMRTHLHLLANSPGIYKGVNTQFNGDGFSDMHFTVHVVEPTEMQQWIQETQKSSNSLSSTTYEALLTPSENEPPKFYGQVTDNIFEDVIHTYMNSMGPIHPRYTSIKTSS